VGEARTPDPKAPAPARTHAGVGHDLTRRSHDYGWSIFSSLPQPLLAVPRVPFVDTFQSILPVGLGFAAGAMGMVLGELLPEPLETAPARVVALAGGTAFALMVGFQLVLS
jgi:zinc transporter ZupT